jgi:thioesterase domain-containing protein
MTPETNVDKLTIAITKSLTLQSAPRSTKRCPVVFFLPPSVGDYPKLARFRAAFADRIRFVVIHYPQWRELVSGGGSLDTMVDAALMQIRAEFDEDTYFLTGYSSGGIIAVELARRIVESGGRVAFLGLIDSRIGGHPKLEDGRIAKITRRLRRIVMQPQYAVKALWVRLIAWLASVTPLWSLLVIGQVAKALPPKLTLELNWRLMLHVRERALARWKIKPLDSSMVLFRSDEDWEPPDCGWGALCRHLTVVAVKGSHGSMLDPLNRDTLCAKFLEMVDAAWTHLV